MKHSMAGLLAALLGLATVAPVDAIASGINMPASGVATPASAVGDLGTALLSAVVTAKGSLVRGEGATGANHGLDIPEAFTGYYLVKFTRDVRACAYVGNVAYPQPLGVPPAGYVATVVAANDPRNIVVETFDASGNHADRDFHLIVVCGH